MRSNCDNKNHTGFSFLPEQQGLNYRDDDLKVTYLGSIIQSIKNKNQLAD
jgi:hypothetical protein